jgi:Flp pilus assembly protein TadD
LRRARVPHDTRAPARAGSERLRLAWRLLFLASKHFTQGEEIMFRRLSAWHILTAGLIGLSSAACGSGAREDATSQEKTAASAPVMPPSVAASSAQLTSVKPAPAPLPEARPVEPEIQPGAVKSADEVLDRLVFDAERKPADVRLRVRVARAMLDAGKLGEARVHAERAVEVDQKSPGAWNMLGRIELAERDHAAAAASFQRAVEEDPENSYSWNNLGYALIEQHQFEEAAAALENATSGTSPTAYMWNNLGMAYEHVDRIREARAAYRQAAEGGSAKGQANLDRLEGVTSLVPAAVADDEVDIEKVELEESELGGSSGGSASQHLQAEEPGC